MLGKDSMLPKDVNPVVKKSRPTGLKVSGARLQRQVVDQPRPADTGG